MPCERRHGWSRIGRTLHRSLHRRTGDRAPGRQVSIRMPGPERRRRRMRSWTNRDPDCARLHRPTARRGMGEVSAVPRKRVANNALGLWIAGARNNKHSYRRTVRQCIDFKGLKSIGSCSGSDWDDIESCDVFDFAPILVRKGGVQGGFCHGRGRDDAYLRRNGHTGGRP